MRILIAEDEFLVAVQLEEDLRAAGYVVVGPFSSVDSALEAARQETFDLAILDINLNGTMAFPVAEELTAREIPYFFLTGYIGSHLPEKFRSIPQVPKPYDPVVLMREIERAVPASDT